jgi:ribosomal protein L3
MCVCVCFWCVCSIFTKSMSNGAFIALGEEEEAGVAAVHPAATTRRSGAASAPSRRRSTPADGGRTGGGPHHPRSPPTPSVRARHRCARASWDVGEASSSASAPRPIIGRRRGDLEEEANLARALAESAATAAAKKRREEEEAAVAVAAVELFKQQEKLEARAWAQGERRGGRGDPRRFGLDHRCRRGRRRLRARHFGHLEDAASSGELATNYPF